jgi:ABC-2 type transport system permease protein
MTKTFAFLMRDLRLELSYRFSFFLQFFGIFASVFMFYFLAQLIGPAAGPTVGEYGGNYFAFVLIGIAFSGYFGVGLSSFAGTIRQAQTTGTLEAMLVTPTPVSLIVLSSALWEYLVVTFHVLVYLAVGALILGVDLSNSNVPAALLTLILTVTSFSSIGIIAASFIMVLKRGDPVTWLFNSVSSLLGGVYYPVAILPDWLQAVSALLPITYALRAMRLALLQGASVAQILPELLALAGFTVVLMPLSLAAFRWAVHRAKVDGSLTYY